MIAIFVAMPGEATPFIDALGLKGSGDIAGSRVYSDDKYILTITGIGKVNAACAVTALLSKYEEDIDLVVNIGTCAGEDKGRTDVIDRICDIDSGRDFYPDMVYKIPFDEICLHTSDRYKTDSSFNDEYGRFVYDMEGAAVFAAASNFVSPDRIILIKTVSDSGDPDIVTAGYCVDLLSPSVQSTLKLIEDIASCVSSDPYSEADSITSCYEEQLHCSEYMRNDLKRLIRFALSSDIDIRTLIDPYLPVRDRVEGKKVMEDVRQKLLQ